MKRPQRALVLAGGNALGCYLAGAYQALHEAGEPPDWIAGSSIGAITGGLLAGNPPERRLERLHAFWDSAMAPGSFPTRGARWLTALQTRLLGRPTLFHGRLPSLGDDPSRLGLYDPEPMRRLLTTLIDFDLLNSAQVRLSVLTVDLQTGARVVFDTTQAPVTVEHLMASAALIPDFPPVRIGERWLVDGGLAANLPADLVLGHANADDLVCYMVDLFPPHAQLPNSLAALSMRQTDLTFASQTDRTLEAMAARHTAESPRIDVVRTCYARDADETAMKSWDFSRTALTRRWETGHSDMAAALRNLQGSPSDRRGLTIHPIAGAMT